VVERRIRRDPPLHLLQGRSPDRRGLALAAELQLPAWPLEEHDELTRDTHGDVAAEILLDQGEGQIEPGRHARRADLPVTDMESSMARAKVTAPAIVATIANALFSFLRYA
jgi:hypothetical protein